MSKTIPVLYRDGLLVPQIELEGFEEGQRFEIEVPDAEELALVNGDDPWIGFISTEDSLETVRRTAGSWGSLPADLAQWIIESDEILEENLSL